MTTQEIFDKVVIHLLTQKKQSKYKGACLYKSPEGLKCAVGCLIDDEFYSPKFEGFAIGIEDTEEPDPIVMGIIDLQRAVAQSLKTPLTPEILGLLHRLQAIHDDYEPSDWEDQLSALAAHSNLRMPPSTNWEPTT